MQKLVSVLVLSLMVVGSTHAAGPMQFRAHLEGFNLVGNPVDTNATGQAIAEVVDGGTAVFFQLNVAGINNLLMAHIHVSLDEGPVAVTDPSGPVAYWFTGGPPPGTVVTETVNGRLAQGFIITNGDVEDWDPDPMNSADPGSGTVAGLINAIEEGRASVIVHTDDLNAATPGGVAGDSRAGELRGTLR